MTNRRRALQHYQRAIQAFSEDQYGVLTDCERQALLRVLRAERRRLLREVVASEHDTRPTGAPCTPE